jgi:hypothetical protein
MMNRSFRAMLRECLAARQDDGRRPSAEQAQRRGQEAWCFNGTELPVPRLGEPAILVYHIHATISTRTLGDSGMKCLIVYYMNGQWIGEDVSWKRSGSGSYRETSRIEIPQTKAQIEAFAAENRYVIEWRGKIPADSAAKSA